MEYVYKCSTLLYSEIHDSLTLPYLDLFIISTMLGDVITPSCGFDVFQRLVAEIRVVKRGIRATPGEKFLVISHFHDATMVEHHDPVYMTNGPKTMRYDNGCAVLHGLFQRFLDTSLGKGVNRGRCLVQN